MACVISSDPSSRQAIATALGDLESIEVECLDLTRRSIDKAGSRDFGLIVADVRAGDPVALLGGLARRLSGVTRRGIPVVIAHGPDDGGLPAIASLVRQAGGVRLTRPIEPTTLVAMLDTFVGVSEGLVVSAAT